MRGNIPSRLILLCTVVGLATPVYGAVEENREIEAGLRFPWPGAVDVRADTLVFAYNVTALTLEGPGGVQVPTTLEDETESSVGTVFAPSDDLAPGDWRAMGVPTDDCANWAGNGVFVDLGTFTVGDAVERVPMVPEIEEARWMDYSRGSDWLSVDLLTPLGYFEEPVILEIDVADADSAMDGEPDFASAWTQSNELRAYSWEDETIDPQSAMVRVRAIDMSGHASDWSAPASFEVEQMRVASSGCSAMPGRSGVAGTLGLLLALAIGLARRSRTAA